MARCCMSILCFGLFSTFGNEYACRAFPDKWQANISNVTSCQRIRLAKAAVSAAATLSFNCSLHMLQEPPHHAPSFPFWRKQTCWYPQHLDAALFPDLTNHSFCSLNLLIALSCPQDHCVHFLSVCVCQTLEVICRVSVVRLKLSGSCLLDLRKECSCAFRILFQSQELCHLHCWPDVCPGKCGENCKENIKFGAVIRL